MHNLQLNEDQTLILDTVSKFVQDAVAPAAQEKDEHRQFLADELRGLAELGLFGLSLAESSGGAGMGLLPFAACCEEIAAHSGSLARLLAGQAICVEALAACGSDRLEAALAGEELAAWIGPEHGIAFEGGVLRGSVEMAPAASEAALLVVAVRSEEGLALAVVAADAAARTPLRPLGLASAGCARVVLDGVAPLQTASGEQSTAAIARCGLMALVSAAAACVGMGRACVDLGRKHTAERVAFGKPLLQQQAVARKLVDGRRGIDAARQLVYQAARLCDLGEAAEATALQAKVAAAEAAQFAADEGIQVHGGYGYTVEYHVERHYRDAKTLEVLDGGSEHAKDRLAQLQFLA